ncbi:haloacid dehalogenase-like hydrolase [Pseudomonas aeruginosa]|nr:haloacid dehalogenase-like hydrolase [Pseudomonas aeruginosa]WGW99246.1 haloacid dehalogenase-like hydrolase [Pseudomonas aeruginosa]
MRLAPFDLDNTLLAGDSDHSWGEWLCQRGLVDAAEYQARNDAFYADYVAGKLDVLAYQAFTQAILGRTEMAWLETWHRQFMQEVIEPIVLAKGEALLADACASRALAGDHHRHQPLRHRPDRRTAGVETLIATECEMRDGRYTGQTFDALARRAARWCACNAGSTRTAWTWKAPASTATRCSTAAAGSTRCSLRPSTLIRAYAPRRKNAAGRSFPC